MSSAPARERLAAVDAVVFDVDGVLTDGRIVYGTGGEQTHAFHVRDGFAILRACKVGFPVAIISGRHSAGVARRLRELRVRHIFQGVDDKRQALLQLRGELGIDPSRMAFVGDDINDLPVMRMVGLAVGVADCVQEVKDHVVHTGWWLKNPGGAGAAREVLQPVLEAHGLWYPAEPS